MPFPGTHAVCLRNVHVAVGVVVHLLVDVADRLKADDGILVLAQRLVNTAEIWRTKWSVSDAAEAKGHAWMSIINNYKSNMWNNTLIEILFKLQGIILQYYLLV